MWDELPGNLFTFGKEMLLGPDAGGIIRGDMHGARVRGMPDLFKLRSEGAS